MSKKISLIVIAAVLIVTCGDETTEDYRLEDTETYTWSAGGINQINGITLNGDITVTAVQETTITAIVTRICIAEDSSVAAEHIDDIVITDDVSNNILTLQAEFPDTTPEDIDLTANFDFSCPEQLYLDLSTVNGSVSVTDMIAGADIGLVNGDITTDNFQGSIVGTLVNGTIDCDLSVLAAADSAILTLTNGDITLSLPSDVSAAFDAFTGNGTVTVTGFASVNYTTDESNHKAGTIGGGGAVIALQATNGDIILRAR
jgi:DUF4097 and DUF4098 domain-containing protein YvlB